MKSAEYVALVTGVYRAALDRAADDARAFEVRDGESGGAPEAFSRGFTEAYLSSERGNDMMSYRRPNNRGVPVGRVATSRRARATIALDVAGRCRRHASSSGRGRAVSPRRSGLMSARELRSARPRPRGSQSRSRSGRARRHRATVCSASATRRLSEAARRTYADPQDRRASRSRFACAADRGRTALEIASQMARAAAAVPTGREVEPRADARGDSPRTSSSTSAGSAAPRYAGSLGHRALAGRGHRLLGAAPRAPRGIARLRGTVLWSHGPRRTPTSRACPIARRPRGVASRRRDVVARGRQPARPRRRVCRRAPTRAHVPVDVLADGTGRPVPPESCRSLPRIAHDRRETPHCRLVASTARRGRAATLGHAGELRSSAGARSRPHWSLNALNARAVAGSPSSGRGFVWLSPELSSPRSPSSWRARRSRSASRSPGARS